MPLRIPGLLLLASLPLLASTARAQDDAVTTVAIDSSRHVVTVTIAPLTVPVTGAHHGGHAPGGMAGHDSPFFRATWPIEAWLRGFSVELHDADGRVLPRKHLHHVSMVNMSRRQLVYSAFERILGAGQEQSEFTAPKTIGVPLAPGMELGTFIGWYNDTGKEIVGAKLVMQMKWLPANIKPRPAEVLPVWLDVGYRPGLSDAYDLPPGPSSRIMEFTVPISGRILAAGGHLHDNARFVRLEEAETGKVLFSLDAKVDSAGKLLEMPRELFGARGEGIPLRVGRKYRVRADYVSPEADTLPAGAMGLMVVLYRPDDMSQWPTVDLDDPDQQKDLTFLEMMGVPMAEGGAPDHGAHQH